MKSQSISLEDLVEKLSNLLPQEFAALMQAYRYYWLKGWMRSTSWLNLVLGGITLWLGLSGIDQGVLKAIQALLGAIILAQSLWGIILPTAQTVLGFSIVFLLAGIWNLFIAIVFGLENFPIILVLLGVFQLKWSFDFVQRRDHM